MNTVKEEVRVLLDELPNDCTFEDIQYHLYVVEKTHKGIERAEESGVVEQGDVEKRFAKWSSR